MLNMTEVRCEKMINDKDKTTAVINFAKQLADEQHLKAIIKYSGTGGLAVGSLAAVPSFMSGTFSSIVGGPFANLLGYGVIEGEYKPLSTVIQEMTPQNKRKLKDHIETIMEDLNVCDILALMNVMASDSTIKSRVAKSIIKFISEEIGIRVVTDN